MPRLLDLFCGAGGAAVGYQRAGFDVVGVDIDRQPHYPYKFILADAFEYAEGHWYEYDVIHTSPVCKAYTTMSNCVPDASHPRQIPALSLFLKGTRKPYVIENVVGARKELDHPILLCGKMFGLKVYRHRLFEIHPYMPAPYHSRHRDRTPKAGRGLRSPKGFVSVAGHVADMAYCKQAMGIDWMNQSELSQAIPPAYTEWIGLNFITLLSKGDRNGQ